MLEWLGFSAQVAVETFGEWLWPASLDLEKAVRIVCPIFRDAQEIFLVMRSVPLVSDSLEWSA